MLKFTTNYKPFNIEAVGNYLFVETKSPEGNSLLTIADVPKGEIILQEKPLELPAHVFLKYAEVDYCIFAECVNSDLPEIAFFHFVNHQGEIFKSAKNFVREAEGKKNLVQKFDKNSDYFLEAAFLIKRQPNCIQSDIYYLETPNNAYLLFIENWSPVFIKVSESGLFIFPTENLAVSNFEDVWVFASESFIGMALPRNGEFAGVSFL
jgi:hypothetical protein